jgi:hypothetical protein
VKMVIELLFQLKLKCFANGTVILVTICKCDDGKQA